MYFVLATYIGKYGIFLLRYSNDYLCCQLSTSHVREARHAMQAVYMVAHGACAKATPRFLPETSRNEISDFTFGVVGNYAFHMAKEITPNGDGKMKIRLLQVESLY